MRTVDNNQDILDGRDVIARFEELNDERERLTDALSDARDDAGEGPGGKDAQETAQTALREWDYEHGAELAALAAFVAEGTAEWRHGKTLIRESYFATYARELAEDMGALKDCDHWPATCIDWEKAARELKYDHTGADFDGVTYYYRT